APGHVVATVRARRVEAGDLEQRRSPLDDDAPEVLASPVRDVDVERDEAADLVFEAWRPILAQAPRRRPLLGLFVVPSHVGLPSMSHATLPSRPLFPRGRRTNFAAAKS